VLCTEADADQARWNSAKVGTAFEKLEGTTRGERFRTAENVPDHIILDNDLKLLRRPGRKHSPFLDCAKLRLAGASPQE
jgi:hypothetical protein